ncbi:MAG: S-methyl-5-thioribose-1-phosphate isomerase [Gammaproteobacteria bacterium]|nr:S-methyl-5-thioribose-1-phosphate isomerase [Gammaproteobacteria bacterium]
MNIQRELRDTVRPVVWEDGVLKLLDQRRLPGDEVYLRLRTVLEVESAIREMVVRGAPAIGVAAAYGVVLAAREAYRNYGIDWRPHTERMLQSLAGARPTGANLRWAIERMRARMDGLSGEPEPALLDAARRLHEQDIAGNRRLGELGAALLRGGDVITHCNAGSLATGGFGTALGIIRSAFAQGRLDGVFACETRPWLQGARLTAWELERDGVPVTVIADSAAASLMAARRVKWIIVGADRIAANGDVANKIGTYGLAVLARHHRVKFMVAAPLSSIDPATASGRDIPIESRDPSELKRIGGTQNVPRKASVWNPVFDVTPAGLVDYLVTEKGVIERPRKARISALLRRA